MKTLVLFAHPAHRHSQTNRLMLDAARRIEGITVVDLYAEYPRFEIDVEREQQRLLDHEAIVFQFPLYWYSTPSLLKEWQDLVLEHGFAYGETGVALAGKPWLCAVTTGAPEHAYGADSKDYPPVRRLLLPLEATANLCRMTFLAPYVLFGALGADEARRRAHVDGYVRLLESLRDDRLDIEASRASDHLAVARLDSALIG
jgi:glutathione-regulated potassium-efflux system ancillary protein KefG